MLMRVTEFVGALAAADQASWQADERRAAIELIASQCSSNLVGVNSYSVNQ
jgi:hypothetical protein